MRVIRVNEFRSCRASYSEIATAFAISVRGMMMLRYFTPPRASPRGLLHYHPLTFPAGLPRLSWRPPARGVYAKVPPAACHADAYYVSRCQPAASRGYSSSYVRLEGLMMTRLICFGSRV